MTVATLSSALHSNESIDSGTGIPACLILSRAADQLPPDVRQTLSRYTLVAQPSVYHFAAFLARQSARAIVVDAVTLTQQDVHRLGLLTRATGVPLWLLPFRGPAAITNALHDLNAIPWAVVQDMPADPQPLSPGDLSQRRDTEFLVDGGVIDHVAAQQSPDEESGWKSLASEKSPPMSSPDNEPFSDHEGPLLSADELKALLQ